MRVNNSEISRPKGWRTLGIYIPGIITAGIYRSHGKKVFWDVIRKEKTIIIDLQNDNYKQIVIEVENLEISVGEINEKLR